MSEENYGEIVFYSQFKPLWLEQMESDGPEGMLTKEGYYLSYYAVAHKMTSDSLEWSIEQSKTVTWQPEWVKAAEQVLIERALLEQPIR